MPYDVTLADRLRADGLRVREVDGWQRRGNRAGPNFHPRGMVIHHTAGAPRSAGVAPSLGVVVHGRSDLPGPLCNLYMDYDGVVYAVAAGAANHAGTPDGGSCKGMTGNSTAWGFEIEHPGTFPLEADRAELAARAVAAVIRGTCEADMAVFHREWAPSRKIDLATAPTPAAMRARITHYLAGGEAAVDLPDWFWSWASWYLTTSREASSRPAAAPAAIPAWAWTALDRLDRIAKRYGMSSGERAWIAWKDGGEAGARPNVPQTIPPRWWDDLAFVERRGV